MDNNIYTIIVSILTILGSAAAFRYYEKRALHKERDEDFIRHDCKDRISKLEKLLEESASEKDDLRDMVLNLSKEVAALSVKVEFITRENDELHKKTKTKKQLLNG